MTTAKTIVTKPIPRRTVLGGMAAGAFTLAGPYVARAQQADINIGVLLPFTGSQGAYGPDMRKAAELTTKIVNDAGGILGGRKFKLYFEDDESSPTAGLAATKKLLEVNKCVAVMGQPDRNGDQAGARQRQYLHDGLGRCQRHNRW